MKRSVYSSRFPHGSKGPTRTHRGKTVAAVGGLTLIGFALISLVAGALNVSIASKRDLRGPVPPPPAIQPTSRPPSLLHSRLSLQPEANKMRRRVGQRFIAGGPRVSVLTGTLVRGSDTRAIVIRREQRDDGEHLTITLAGGLPNIQWDQTEGPSAPGRAIDEDTRFVIDRLALDSPDQFIFAQLRGASYYVIARDVMPEEAQADENYNGPVWDVVRVGEPDSATYVNAHSPWHVFYVNSATGLIDRVISADQGTPVTAELTAWSSVGGEIIPTHITWSRNHQVVMELNVGNGQFGARQ